MSHASRGFMALISVLVLATILLATTIDISQSSILARQNELDVERSAQSQENIVACSTIYRLRQIASTTASSTTFNGVSCLSDFPP